MSLAYDLRIHHKPPLLSYRTFTDTTNSKRWRQFDLGGIIVSTHNYSARSCQKKVKYARNP